MLRRNPFAHCCDVVGYLSPHVSTDLWNTLHSSSDEELLATVTLGFSIPNTVHAQEPTLVRLSDALTWDLPMLITAMSAFSRVEMGSLRENSNIEYDDFEVLDLDTDQEDDGANLQSTAVALHETLWQLYESEKTETGSDVKALAVTWLLASFRQVGVPVWLLPEPMNVQVRAVVSVCRPAPPAFHDALSRILVVTEGPVGDHHYAGFWYRGPLLGCESTDGVTYGEVISHMDAFLDALEQWRLESNDAVTASMLQKPMQDILRPLSPDALADASPNERRNRLHKALCGLGVLLRSTFSGIETPVLRVRWNNRLCNVCLFMDF